MIAIALLLVAAAAQALPAPPTSYTYPGKTFYQDDQGQYSYSEHSQQGAMVQDRGTLRTALDGTRVVAREGNVQYTSPEGVPVVISYTADETGYHPHGNVIPGVSAP